MPGRGALCFAEPVDHAAELFAIHLDPAPSHERQPLGPGQQSANFGSG